MVNAVTSIEDRRFFEHGGVDYFRLLGALRDDLRLGRRREGGSTLTMQLARGFFLTPEKKVKRKIIEIAITFQLEHRFNKQQIFQLYANEIPLGQQGSFAINGFGQAAQTYFGKDVRQLDLAQCALLAGMIQHPSYLNPYRHPERATQRRNLVLDAMVGTGKITKEEAIVAKAEPLTLTPINIDAGEAPYFVDLVRDRLVQHLGDADFNHQGLRIYTSLDPDLQQVATDAVAEGMKVVDAQVDRLHARRIKQGDNSPLVYPQVALVALNPHTGQVLALVGGRNYGASQFDHAVQNRPPGSAFKPFVYAAAFNTSLAGTILTQPPPQPQADIQQVSAAQDSAGQVAGDPAPADPGRPSGIFTAITKLNNDPTVFEDGYAPANYHHDTRFLGDITARLALAESENNATISLAQMVGYNNVAALARDAGIKSARGTPSVALGSYGATPIDMAGAYTTFANGGVRIDPWLVASVRSASGDVLNDYPPDSKPILDPRVAYLTVSLMENVVNAGTGAGVRAAGFTAPAAGKTGTSHDAWFAGFTSNLLCVVWIGNDDYTDLKLDGAKAAAFHLGRVHEARCPAAAVLRHPPVRRSPTGSRRCGWIGSPICSLTRAAPQTTTLPFLTEPRRPRPAIRLRAISAISSRNFLGSGRRPPSLPQARATECRRCLLRRWAHRPLRLQPSRDRAPASSGSAAEEKERLLRKALWAKGRQR